MLEGPAPVVTGGRLGSAPLQFAKDSKHFVSAVGSSLKVVSVATGATVAQLHGHEDTVTGMLIDQSNSQRLWSCSLDGTVRQWDFLEANQSAPPTDLGFPALGMAQHAACKGQLFVLCGSGGGGSQSRLIQLDPRKKKSTRLLKTSKSLLGLAVTHKGTAVATLCGNRLFVHNLRTNQLRKHTHKRPLCAIAASPTEDTIATADLAGRIVLWYGTAEETVRTASMHWHAHQVSGLQFSSDGRQLLSGGLESVLVLWRVEGGEAANKQFLPRQGAAICSVSSDSSDSLFGMVCADNSVRVIEAASLTLKQRIDGIYPCTSSVRCPVLQPPGSKHTVWLPGRPGSLQLWDHAQQRALGELDVVQQNLLSQTNNEKPLHTHVQFAGITQDGQQLVTADRREHSAAGSAVVCASHLKFWEYSPDKKSFVLSTLCDQPHKGPISTMALDGHSQQLVSVGEDGQIRLWRPKERTLHKRMGGNGAARGQLWGCVHHGSYCGLPGQACGFSGDGSLLAIGFGGILTLWSSTAQVELLKSIPQQPLGETITQLCFLPNLPLLVVCTQAGIVIWDLLTLAPVAQYEVAGVTALAAHPHRSAFAAVASVLTPEGTPEDPVLASCLVLWEGSAPSMMWPLEHRARSVCWAGEQLLVLTEDHRMLSFSPTPSTAPEPQPQQDQTQATQFDALFGTSAKKAKRSIQGQAAAAAAPQHGSAFGGIASHLLPSLGALYQSLLGGLLPAASTPQGPEPEPCITAAPEPQPAKRAAAQEHSQEQLAAQQGSEVLAGMFSSWGKPTELKKRKRLVAKLF